MFDTWLRTVFGDSTSRSVMSVFDRPWAISSRISRSRSVSSGKAAGSARGARPREERPQASRDRRAEDRLARRDGPDRPHELDPLGTLEQVAAGTGAHRGEHRLVVVVHRQHEDGHVRRRIDDPARRLDAVDARHVHVHQHHVGLRDRDRRDDLVAARRLADNLDVVRRSPAAPCSPARNAAWSSATARGSVRRLGSRRRPPSGSLAKHARPALGPAFDRDLAADLGRALPHGLEAGPGPRLVRETASVVGHLDRQLAAGVQPDRGTRSRPRGARRWSWPRPRSGRPRPRRPPAARAARIGLALDVDGGRPRVARRSGLGRRPRSRRAAWWPIAPASPSSSSAGGRSPSTSRRTSASASRTSSLSASSWRRAASGSSSSTAADASARMPIAASAGPEPVVEVSSETPALLLAGDDQPLARAGEASRSRWAWTAAPA